MPAAEITAHTQKHKNRKTHTHTQAHTHTYTHTHLNQLHDRVNQVDTVGDWHALVGPVGAQHQLDAPLLLLCGEAEGLGLIAGRHALLGQGELQAAHHDALFWPEDSKLHVNGLIITLLQFCFKVSLLLPASGVAKFPARDRDEITELRWKIKLSIFCWLYSHMHIICFDMLGIELITRFRNSNLFIARKKFHDFLPQGYSRGVGTLKGRV